MSTYFTIDAFGTLREGLIVQTEAVTDSLEGAEALVLEGASELCPGGVSAHGRLHLLQPPADQASVEDAYAEVILELARRDVAPAAPSRLAALFAFCSLDDARGFAASRRRPDSAIFEVAADHAFVGDLHWVGLGSTPLLSLVYAQRYWSGDAHPVGEPLWEALIPLPATIGARVR